MKRFSKVLSLVLVLCMALSLFAVSAGAAFNDAAEIRNEEAAAVATALGIVDGYEDGTFGPAKTLTRAEATTLIARLLLTPEKAGKLTNSVSAFADVPGDNWAAGYIAYAYARGIVAGVGNNNFNPNGTLTVSQFAKMLLVALGYDADNEGFVGAAWAINVQTVADNAGLFDGLDVDVDADCSRDTAVQMILNTLEGTMVKYASNGVDISVGGATINVGSSAAASAGTTFMAKYFPKLVYSETATGDFGRPAGFSWTYKGTTVYTGSDEDDTLLATYTGYAYTGSVYNLIGATAYKKLLSGEAKAVIYYNGERDGAYVATLSNIVTKDADDNGFMYTSTKAYCAAPGVQTEIYMDENYNVTIVVIPTYLAQVTDEYDTSAETLELEVYGYDKTIDTMYAKTENGLALTSYSEEDWVLVTVDDGEIASVAPASVVSGTINSYTAYSSIKVDGTAYSYASTFWSKLADASSPFQNGSFTIASDISLILNQYGQIIGLEAVETDANYAFVIDYGTTGALSSSSLVAGLYFTDGSYNEVTVKAVYTAGGSEYKLDEDSLPDGWFTYSVNSAGKYLLTEVNTVDVTNQPYKTVSGSAQFLTNSTGKVVDSVKATSATKFYVLDDDGDLSVYTGYAAVPTVNKSADKNISVSVVENEYGYASFVFIDASNTTIKGAGSTGSGYMLVYNGYAATSVNEDNVTYKMLYYAYVNGAAAYPSTTISTLAAGFYTDLVYDEYGYIDEAEKVTASVEDEYVVSKLNKDYLSVDYYDDVVTIDGVVYELAEDAVIYVQTAAAKLSSYSLSKLAKLNSTATGLNTLYGVLNEDGYVSALYLVY